MDFSSSHSWQLIWSNLFMLAVIPLWTTKWRCTYLAWGGANLKEEQRRKYFVAEGVIIGPTLSISRLRSFWTIKRNVCAMLNRWDIWNGRQTSQIVILKFHVSSKCRRVNFVSRGRPALCWTVWRTGRVGPPGAAAEGTCGRGAAGRRGSGPARVGGTAAWTAEAGGCSFRPRPRAAAWQSLHIYANYNDRHPLRWIGLKKNFRIIFKKCSVAISLFISVL